MLNEAGTTAKVIKVYTGTILFKETNANPTIGGNPELLTLVGDRIYFRADNGINGVELWSTNGTTAGTNMVQDIQAGPTGSYPVQIFESGGKIFIVVTTTAYGTELWVANAIIAPPPQMVEVKKDIINIALLKSNPVAGEINLTIKLSKSDHVKWQLLDNNGRVIKKGYYDLSSGNTAVSEDVSNLVPGNYLMQLDGKSLQQTIKVVKE